VTPRPPAAPPSAQPRFVPTTHRSLARLQFPASRWAHVLLLPAALSLCVWWLAAPMAQAWAWSMNQAIAAFDLNGTIAATAPRGMNWEVPSLLLADVPAAPPTMNEVFVGALASTLLLLLSYLLPMERTAARYLVRALAICHASSVAFFGLFDRTLPYSLNAHLESSFTMVWMFMLITPWMHAVSFNVFGFRLWQELALTLATVAFLFVFAPVQLFFHLSVVQQYSLLQLPVLYLLGGLLLDVLIFICLYAWAMSWRGRD
jgi:hypothetical protein